MKIYFRRTTAISTNHSINDQIRVKEVRLIAENGDQIGIVLRVDAQSMADDKQLDLVMISPQANPPVCKIMNYGKFKFDIDKKDKEVKKNQKANEAKELSLSATIDTHDLETKAKHCIKFLSEYEKVKISIRMKGRQQARPQLAVAVMFKFFELVKDYCTIDFQPKQEGRNVIMILAKNKEKK